ncbi:CopG family transcriptional regulator [Chelatococcus sambhunathii]|uniref:CopG family transcriptional regulator n=1 Tax=Chelatococcus sambhunathii TaxID=363953 RepID=A0ABU1DKP3_9HYPH|nr:hypothetical protein [Chelatococcus sambhunathii]MDR4308686.1 CopG family transcriptional regulator [Chelatococcus sambhunathii]
MKNVTVSMDDDLAGWARVEAAKRGRSLSGFLADVLAEMRSSRERSKEPDATLLALEGFLTGPGFPGAAKAWAGREELYGEREADLLRRHQHPDLRGRPDGD